MEPTGDYVDFVKALGGKYYDYDPWNVVTFGILIADPRQSEAKEYIYNYLDIFHEKSGRDFDFFIPGYTKNNQTEALGIQVADKKYDFNQRKFKDFLKQIKDDFNIEYTFNPMLILMSTKLEDIRKAQYIVLELDNIYGYDIRRSGMFFMDLFNFARTYKSLREINTELMRNYLLQNGLAHIFRILQQEVLLEIMEIGDNFKRYKIRKL